MELKTTLLLALSATCSAASSSQQFNLPKPFGKYDVGKTQFFLNHTTLNDPIAPANWNHTTSFLLVSAYYPTKEHLGDGAGLRWVDDILAELAEQGWGFPAGLLKRIHTQLQWKASPISFPAGAKKLPTVLVSPGAGGPCSTYTILSTDLASYGYTVACIDHPGEAPYLAFPPGSTPPGVYGRDINHASYPLSLVNKAINVRIADAKALLKQWSRIAKEHNFPGDACNFVGVGHSLGGAVVGGLVAQNTEFLGAVNLDGTFFDIADQDARRPFLLLTSAGHNSSTDSTWAAWEDIQTGWWEELTVNGSVHMNFDDESYVVDMLGLPEGDFAGPIDRERMRVITIKLVESLFAKVEGKGGAFLEEPFPNEAWPEIIRVKAS